MWQKRQLRRQLILYYESFLPKQKKRNICMYFSAVEYELHNNRDFHGYFQYDCL